MLLEVMMELRASTGRHRPEELCPRTDTWQTVALVTRLAVISFSVSQFERHRRQANTVFFPLLKCRAI